jgi:hypothetical protein
VYQMTPRSTQKAAIFLITTVRTSDLTEDFLTPSLHFIVLWSLNKLVKWAVRIARMEKVRNAYKVQSKSAEEHNARES